MLDSCVIPAPIMAAARQLAGTIAHPFYLIHLDAIGDAFDDQKREWRKRFPRLKQAYSYKTNPLSAITTALRSRGACAEVVSGDEILWARNDGFLAREIAFNGPGKTDEELSAAIQCGVRLHVDSVDEYRKIVEICRLSGRTVEVLLRLAVRHNGRWSRFGLMDDESQQIISQASAGGPIKVVGIHIHSGSNLPSPVPMLDALIEHIALLRLLLDQSGEEVELNLGGGVPAKSLGRPFRARDFPQAVSELLCLNDISLDRLSVAIEPGRSLVEDHGWLVCSIVARKEREGQSILIVDIGSNLIRSASTWLHPMRLLSDYNVAHEIGHTVYGNLCFEADLITQRLDGPRDIGLGSRLIIGSIGGYDLPSANQWGRRGPPIWGMEGSSCTLVPRQGRIAGGDV